MMARDDDEDESEAPEVAAGDIEIVVYGRDEGDRREYLDRLESALEEMGYRPERDEHTITWDLDTDMLSALDDLSGWMVDPPAGVHIQAGVIDHEGDFIPISQAWQSWSEILEDVEDNGEEYLAAYGETDK